MDELENKLDKAANFFENINKAIDANATLVETTTNANTSNTNLNTTISAGNTLKTALDALNTSANATKSNLDISNNNALATKTTLDTSNTNAATTKTTLDASNSAANVTKSNLDSSNSTANSTKTDLDKSNANALATKTDLDKLNTTANVTKADLTASNDKAIATTKDLTDINTTANVTKTDLDAENVRAEANITAMESFGDITALSKNVTNLKAEVETARGGESDLDGRLDKISAQLSEKAQNTDNARTTTSKSVTGAINELNSNKQNKYDGSITDFNATLTQGEYQWGNTSLNQPNDWQGYGKLIVIVNDGGTHNNSNNWIWQIAYYTDINAGTWIRNKVNSGSWSSWSKFSVVANGTDVFPFNSMAGIQGANIDTDIKNGFTHVWHATGTLPVGWTTDNDIYILSPWDGNSGWQRQIIFDIRSNNIYQRAKLNGTWTSWVQLVVADKPTEFTVTGQNGFYAIGGSKATYCKTQEGEVIVNCYLVKSSGQKGAVTLFNLPAGYRPDTAIRVSAIFTGANRAGSILIYPNGNVDVEYVDASLYTDVRFATTFVARC
jgi:hypothetical protein